MLYSSSLTLLFQQQICEFLLLSLQISLSNYQLCFEYLERDYQDIIIENIDLFKFDEYCYPDYKNGAIIIVIGNGNGPTYKGDLRKNSCDGSVVREKFYIYELF